MVFKKIKQFFIGLPRDPFKSDTRKNIALIAFLAWIGLGADGLSSTVYGPPEAFLALGEHYHLAFYLAILTAITVFIISTAYNQVIELFPSGGGGYKAASKLIGPRAGLVSGSALIVDYVLTIAISVASGVDATFSLLPVAAQHYKIHAEVFAIFILLLLNLRGMKESIKVLMPIFLGFVITHVGIIIYGILSHKSYLPTVVHTSLESPFKLAQDMGWFFMLALFLRAYSLGGGTYTGLEAVSNNVNYLAEPRVKTGKLTMLYMALSLSLIAFGVILLYLLLEVKPVVGETLNAVAFKVILEGVPFSQFFLFVTLFLETGLLFVAANTGFLGGPAVLSNMAIDSWTPRRFRSLSSRLVTQNGIFLFGFSAILILLWTHGDVSMLVVLYSMNVFLTFTLSLLGLCIYWWKHRAWKGASYHLILSVVGFLVCGSILIITLLEKFTSGGWLTVLITSGVISLCFFIKRHYRTIDKKVKKLDRLLTLPLGEMPTKHKQIDPQKPTAVFLIGKSIGQGMHTLLWVQRMFPGHFSNFVFISAGVVDVGSYGSENTLCKMREEIQQRLQYFIDYSQQHGFAAISMVDYGNDPVNLLLQLSLKASEQFSNPIFFSASLISKQDSWFHRKLHSDTPLILQHYLHLKGLQMVVLPVRLP